MGVRARLKPSFLHVTMRSPGTTMGLRGMFCACGFLVIRPGTYSQQKPQHVFCLLVFACTAWQRALNATLVLRWVAVPCSAIVGLMWSVQRSAVDRYSDRSCFVGPLIRK